MLTEKTAVVMALAPDADRYATDPATDVISMKDYRNATFIVQHGAGATGTATFTVESCDDVTPTTATAIPFKYRISTDGDQFGALTAATASGFTLTAGATQIFAIEVDASELSGDDAFVRVQVTEVVDSPVDAGIVAILSEPRHALDIAPSVLS